MNPTPAPVGVIPPRTYDTPALMVKRYWHRHPHRAFALMRAMMAANPAEYENPWPLLKSRGRSVKTPDGKWEFKITSKAPQYRNPPRPFEIDIDHTIPLYRVFRDFSHLPPHRLINFWGPNNLRAVNNAAHRVKNANEARSR